MPNLNIKISLLQARLGCKPILKAHNGLKYGSCGLSKRQTLFEELLSLILDRFFHKWYHIRHKLASAITKISKVNSGPTYSSLNNIHWKCINVILNQAQTSNLVPLHSELLGSLMQFWENNRFSNGKIQTLWINENNIAFGGPIQLDSYEENVFKKPKLQSMIKVLGDQVLLLLKQDSLLLMEAESKCQKPQNTSSNHTTSPLGCLNTTIKKLSYNKPDTSSLLKHPKFPTASRTSMIQPFSGTRIVFTDDYV